MQLILVDDPNFVPDFNLPPLDFDENGELRLPGWNLCHSTRLSQISQLSLLESGGFGASPTRAPFINLDIRRSSSQGSLGLGSPFGKGNQKPDDGDINMEFGEEEVLPFADFGLTIDADGNLVEQPEPELPPYPPSMVGKAGSGPQLPDYEGLIMSVDEELQMIFGDEELHLPEAALAQSIPQQADRSPVPIPSEEILSSDPSTQEPRRRRKRNNKRMAPDSATHVGREEFKGWTENYVARIEEAHKAPHQVTAAQARKNAYNLIFGMGIMGIGILNSIPGLDHPLAQLFAGEEFRSIVMGDPREEVEESRARRRRSASDAFSATEGNDERRVRARLDEFLERERQAGRNEQNAQIVDDPTMVFGDDLLPEVGREHPGSAMSDHRRSSNVPWNRPSSVIPSSVRSQKGTEGGRHAVESSPRVGRGNILLADPQFSDGNMPAFGSEQEALSPQSGLGPAASVDMQEASTSQLVQNALDREGRNFLGFLERVAANRGEGDKGGDGEEEAEEARRWVPFDDLFELRDKTRVVLAQAFLHVLTLATKGQISVRQDGVEEGIPFGEIHIGVTGPLQEQLEDAPVEMESAEWAEQ